MNIRIQEWLHRPAQTAGTLSADDVHVWHWRHQAAFADGADPSRVLSLDERARAARFLVEKPRTEFVATRSTLRAILGSYTGIAPEGLSFRYSDRGKPALATNQQLCFNISHSEGLSALAVVLGREVGVDIEWIRPDVEAAALAQRFFSANERARLLQLKTEQLTPAFFRCWTRKEAYIKARGDGLSLALDSFDVALETGSQSALLGTRPDAAEADHWTLSDLHLLDGYAAAIALSSSRNLLA